MYRYRSHGSMGDCSKETVLSFMLPGNPAQQLQTEIQSEGHTCVPSRPFHMNEECGSLLISDQLSFCVIKYFMPAPLHHRTKAIH